MKIDWKEWLQISSNIAILIGILLVYLEIQQNQTLTRAQLASEGLVMRADKANNLMGESPNIVLEKACLQPNDLTTGDKIVLSQIFQSRMAEAMRSKRIEDESNIGLSYEGGFRYAFRSIFNYEYGRDWFSRGREYLSEDMAEIADREFSSERVSDCAEGSTLPWGF